MAASMPPLQAWFLCILLVATTRVTQAAAVGNVSNCEKVVDNETCVLADNKCHVEWPGGELLIPGRSMVFTSCDNLFFSADRVVMLPQAAVISTGTLKISARSIVFNNTKLEGTEVYLVSEKEVGCERVFVEDTSLTSHNHIVIACHQGTVHITGKSVFRVLEVMEKDLEINANLLTVDNTVELTSKGIRLESQRLFLAARIARGANLTALAHIDANIGSLGGSWSLDSLALASQNVAFAMDFRVEVIGRSCNNRPAPDREDVCRAMLQHWPFTPELVWKLRYWLPYVEFTSVVFASKEMEMKPRTRILSGSALFCAGEVMTLANASLLTATGRGCPAGLGEGSGEVRSHYAMCGAGGASNMGLGGDGALRREGEKKLFHCAEKGLGTTWIQNGTLPLQGASGGGFWVIHRHVDASCGGGLLWLGTSLLFMNASSRLRADGVKGTMIAGNLPSKATATGGGAGGQILIFTEDFQVDSCMEAPDAACAPPEISAKGGDAPCNSASNSVGGAGGGGFIGLWWLEGFPTAHANLGELVKLDVDGGHVTKTCADVLPQDLHREVRGRPGMAVSLAQCPAGHAGAFCASCPIGQWGDGNQCYLCCNKPKTRNAIYKSPAWPNRTCPFQCVPGVPEVIVNPNCLSHYDFAMGFFGGKLVFRITLGILISIFFIIRLAHWLRRQRNRVKGGRGDSGRWQFPREELPFHVKRIFLLGNNSPGSPWTLPSRGNAENPGSNDDFSRAVEGKEVWRVLEEALQRPLKIPAWERGFWPLLSPWFQLLMLQQRLRRAARAGKALDEHLGVESELWKEPSMKPCIKFGCDDSATTGYLDIFDFARSPLDWAPRNLCQEEQVIVAQGAGSWTRPYELNIADPLLLAVAFSSQGSQGPIGSQRIYSLVCTFNLFSRLVPAQELLDVVWGDDAPAFELLQREVESSARRLNLQVAAHVQLLRLSRRPQGGPILESIRTARSRPESFTDLVHQLPVEAAPSGTEASTGMEEELKLCLVLRADKEHQCDLRQVSGEESQLKKPHGYCYSLRRSLLRFRTQRLLLWVRTSNARVGRISDLLVSLIFFMLILSEVMALVILGTTFDRLDIEQAVWLWLLFPTLLAPCSPLMGLVALLMRQPWLCRLHSQLALMASINVAVVGSVYESQDGLLTPCVVLFVVHVVLCYFAAVYSGFEMSNLDLALAEDSGGDASLFSLRTAASSVPTDRSGRSGRDGGRSPKRPEEDGICMALWPGRSTRARADSVESDLGTPQNLNAASPF